MLEIKFLRENSAILLLLILGALVYGNTLGNAFNLDDNYYTAGNTLTAGGFSALPEIFTRGTFYNGANAGFDYRPIAAASFAIQHEIFGDGPMVSHCINLLLYLATVFIIFKMLMRWCATPNKLTVCFLISLLFLLHPLHTEIVASIKSRDELLSLLCCFTSLRLAFIYLNSDKKYKIIFLFASLSLFGIGLLSKYTILPFLFLFPLSLYFFGNISVKKTALFFVLLWAVALSCHFLKSSILPSLERDFSITENALIDPGYTVFHRLATSFYVMGRYLLLHLFPKDLVFYYGANYVEVVDFSNLLAIFSLLFHGYLAYYCLRHFKEKTLLVYGLLLYLVYMLVFSNLIELAPGMMAERFTYASSLGFCIVLVVLVSHFYQRSQTSLKFNPLYLILIYAGAFGLRTFARNKNWKDKETLYAHDVKVAESSAMVNYLYGDWLLANALEERKMLNRGNPQNSWLATKIDSKLQQSIEHFKKTLTINPLDSLATLNLASCAIQLGSFAEGEQVLMTALKHHPDFTDARFTLALSQKYQHKNLESIENFKKVLRQNPHHILAVEQLNRVQLATADTAGALHTLRLGILNNPSSPVPLAELANHYLQVKDTVTAVGFAEKAAALPPPNNGIFSFLAQYFTRKGDLQKANYYQAKLSGN